MIQKFNTIFSKITLVLLFLLAIPVVSQTVKGELIRGQVFDSSDNLPIPGVTVAEQDNENRTVGGVITDIDGGFAIKLKDANHKLVISAIGYKTKTISIGASKIIKVALVSSIEELKAIVITSKKSNDNGLMKIAERDRTTSSVTISSIFAPFGVTLNPNGTMPNPYSEALNMSPTSTFWQRSATSVQMRNINLGYALSEKHTKSLGISSLRLNLTAINPFILYNPFDYKNPNGAYDVYPDLKTFSLGLNVAF